ncbi:hypothetical protein DVJ77_14955 [Dyella tabacisoli]|uniref:Uncharacterized protein n=1 Tax=Dyella tabacisoli TaxID=2282381 RepID=A0A369ULN7_9GAMM|nr:hypothetical protein DVJ77_14955 [Dyella tabacisoli]
MLAMYGEGLFFEYTARGAMKDAALSVLMSSGRENDRALGFDLNFCMSQIFATRTPSREK